MDTSFPLEETLGGVGSLGGLGKNFEEVVSNSWLVNSCIDFCCSFGLSRCSGAKVFRGIGFGISGIRFMILNLLDRGCLLSSSESSSIDIDPLVAPPDFQLRVQLADAPPEWQEITIVTLVRDRCPRGNGNLPRFKRFGELCFKLGKSVTLSNMEDVELSVQMIDGSQSLSVFDRGPGNCSWRVVVTRASKADLISVETWLMMEDSIDSQEKTVLPTVISDSVSIGTSDVGS
ncbi:hypothetical protein Tco_1538883 [Tanacetum coccineum]